MAYLWITIDPSTALLTPRFMKRCKEILEVIQTHAEENWDYEGTELESIELIKYDVAVDLKGSFLPKV